MFHYFVGKIKDYGEKKILKNDDFGIQVTYKGLKTQGEFFLYPYFDQNKNSYKYLAFDNFMKKKFFEKIHKVPGIGPSIAYSMSMKSLDKIKNAIQESDLSFFQSIKGIWPKTAKRIIVELQSSFDGEDFQKMTDNQEVYNKVIETLKPLGYNINEVKKVLEDIEITFKEENIQDIIEKVISEL